MQIPPLCRHFLWSPQLQRQQLATALPISGATDDAGGVQHAQRAPVPRLRLGKCGHRVVHVQLT